MYTIEEQSYFYLLFIVPILLGIYLYLYFWKKKAQKSFAEKDLLVKLAPTLSPFKSMLKFILPCLAIVLIIIALANPKMGVKLQTVKREGVDIIFAIDVSKSMLTEDVAPNRIEKSKHLVSRIISLLAGDRVGIIAYAAQAFPQLPITTDYAAARLFSNNLNTDMLSSQGTAIGEAIKLSFNYYDDEQQTNRILIIISDGEDHSEDNDLLNIIEGAIARGIRIYTIGIGTSKGSPIPIKNNGVTQFYKKDKDGNVVISKLSSQTLNLIAKNGNGQYINGNNTENTIEFIKKTIAQMDKKEFETTQFSEYKDQYHWFLGTALLLLILDAFILERKTSWIQKLNLFNDKKNT